MEDVSTVSVEVAEIRHTLDVLRKFGRAGCEGFVLWVGVLDGSAAVVTDVVVPPQTPIRGEEGVGYFITGETLFALNRMLSDHEVQMIAQVHSHPGEAYHSAADDRYAVVSTEGGFSLVVPDFGEAAADPSAWAVFRLVRGTWTEMDPDRVRSMFHLT